MSADPLMFPSPTSPSFSAGAAEVLGGVDPDGSPLAEIQTLRTFVNERLTAAVDDILGAFGRTVARYQEQIDRQRRQMNRLRSGSEEEKWNREADSLQDSSHINDAPDLQVLVQTGCSDETDAGFSAAHIKTEGGEEDLDPPSGLERESDVPVLAEDCDTEDSRDYWREEARLCRPEETAAEGQRSDRERRSASDLQEHKQLPPEFSCRVCGEPFQRMSCLVAHTSAHPRACAMCGKELSGSLKRHLRVHREMSFGCSVCGQSFTLRGNLQTHMRIHSGERPFSCNVCGKSFSRRATLVRHIRSHTGEKPYSCSYCGRGFVEKGNLTVHLRTHTGERPYWCSVCDRRFNQLSCFYKHPCQKRGLISAPICHS